MEVGVSNVCFLYSKFHNVKPCKYNIPFHIMKVKHKITFFKSFCEVVMYETFLKLLEEKGVTVADVCRATGINQSTLSNWKVRKNLLSMKNAQLIADYFEVSVDYLLSGKGVPKESSEGKVFYFDNETAEAAQEMFDDPDLRALMSAARGCPAEVIRSTAELLKHFKETNPNG